MGKSHVSLLVTLGGAQQGPRPLGMGKKRGQWGNGKVFPGMLFPLFLLQRAPGRAPNAHIPKLKRIVQRHSTEMVPIPFSKECF